MSDKVTCVLWVRKTKRICGAVCGVATTKTYRGIPICDKHRPSNVGYVIVKEDKQHEAIQEMMDAAQREAQPDLDAIVESHKTPLRGHWAEKDNK